MNKTVKEWIDFLNMGDNHYIGLKSESATNSAQRVIYVPVWESVKKFNGWLDEIVEGAYICNSIQDGNFYHLLIIK